MKKLILVVLLALAGNVGAQVITDPPVGGGSGTTTIASGTTPITGGADTQLCFNDAAFISCGDSGLTYNKTTKFLSVASGIINGSVSTAGRSILTIRDTQTTGQAFQDITGTFPAVRTNETSGMTLNITSGDSDDFAENGLSVTLSNGSGSLSNANASAGKFTSTVAQTGSAPGFGVQGSGYNVGVYGIGNGGGGFNAGVVGSGGAGSNSIGAAFGSGTGSSNVGVYAFLGAQPASGLPSTSGIAALVADNKAIAANIFEARDNGSVVWAVVDNGYIQGTMGEVALNANYTNATATFSATALSVAVVSGRTYSFDLNLMFADSTAADGAQFDFSGGSAAATNFDVHCTAANNVGAALAITNAASTTLATAVQVALALTTQAALTCHGSFVPSGSGTFIVRGAQTAHTAGTLTINRGSSLSVRDARPL